jgi:prepilin-type N-terminal cleavage/methylation domain-containing protein/prepilin-type processing-associated H-X9-DG protein
MKKAFTLVELLIVIAIISALAGIMVVSFSGSTESARAAQCLSNLRNLATAVSSASLNREVHQTENWYVRASDCTWLDIKTSRRNGPKKVYYRHRGWVSNYPGPSGWNETMKSTGRTVTAYDSDDEAVYYALTNGAVWSAIGRRDAYVCPSHLKARIGHSPAWSYVMNAKFNQGILYGTLGKADKTLLFAELPFGGGDGETQADGVLAYPGSGALGDGESIAFNHASGKKKCAHVVFADGHVAKLSACWANSGYKKGWLDEGQDTEYRDLTEWLCIGQDYSFDGKRYEKLQ